MKAKEETALRKAEQFYGLYRQAEDVPLRFLNLYNGLMALCGSKEARARIKSALGLTYRGLGQLFDYCREDGETAGKRPEEEQLAVMETLLKEALNAHSR